MKITAVHVRDFKRIREIKIEPPADSYILVIGGANANGKSSLLDAITVAVGGKNTAPADPVRHGASEATIDIRTDNGLAIKRTIAVDGASKLEVRDELGAVKSPQAVLDKLVAGRFLDPLQFLALKPGDQRAELLRLIDRDGKIAELDSRRDRLFARRTEVGRDLRKLSAQLEGMAPVDPAAPIDVAALAREATELAEVAREHDKTTRAAETAEGERLRTSLAIVQTEQEIARLQAKLAEMHARHEQEEHASIAAAELAAASAEKMGAVHGRRAAIQDEIKRAQEHNDQVAELRAYAKRRESLAAQVAGTQDGHNKLEGDISLIDEAKNAALAAAKLPVPDLGVTADAVTLAGVPLAQASGAERLRVALALAIAANPELRDVWVRDGALLDEDSLAAIAEHARASGVRVWVERVGTRDPGAIVIHDGRVVDAPEPSNGAQRSLFG